jgi:L-aspartate oxidase
VEHSDLIVVGAGAAGLFACLMAARENARVTLISARPLAETASYWAQGGLAAALAVEDSPEQHLQDTLTAGRNLVRRSAAETLVREAAARFHDLEDLGVVFDADRQGHLELALEGGHSARRVLHAGGSATGRRILRQLSASVAESDRIEVLEGRRARALLTDSGGRVVALACDDGTTLAGRAVVLATGGTAAMWSRTTNPPGSFGSGMLLARAVGARLADLEFIQFHPTAVTGVPGREGFLVTEAVRGEGATLHDAAGERFVDELQPRDAVSRAIFRKLSETGEKAAFLDMRALDPTRFPNVVEALRDAGLDPMTELIPVSPATHYAMGGIVTDLHGRAQGVDGLFAVGECACTGLHGANRLASNSLTECFVFGRRAALAALADPAPTGTPQAAGGSDHAPAPTRETREAMWRHAGLERDADGLRPLLEDPHPLARLIGASAIARQETRGAHARSEFPRPDRDLDGVHTVVEPDAEAPAFEPWPT